MLNIMKSDLYRIDRSKTIFIMFLLITVIDVTTNTKEG